MKLLYGIGVRKHPKIKTNEDIKRIVTHLEQGPNWIINEGESYIIRKTLTGKWVWDKGSKEVVDIFGRESGNSVVDMLNEKHGDKSFFEVGRNPNKGFLMIDKTLWGIVKFDVTVKGRKIERLSFPDEILEKLAKDLDLECRKKYNYNIYYVDSFSFEENLSNLCNNLEENIINFKEELPFILYKNNLVEIKEDSFKSFEPFSIVKI